MKSLAFFQGKRVFVTGHTGFKGAWLCRTLQLAGAKVTGYALPPPTEPSLFDLCGIGENMVSCTGDIRDLAALWNAFERAAPEIVFHLAAQPIVRESYRDPVGTYGTNVMGTVHMLECVRRSNAVRSVVNVTTDKVYRNREWLWAYRENEELDGYEPYANSKSCAELVTRSYVRSFFRERNLPVSTARAGNVIGGGDFAADRILPDCVRAAADGREIVLRNPASVRPYQFVLEPLSAYLTIARRQYEDSALADSYNVGPNEEDCLRTDALAEMFTRYWGGGLTWTARPDDGPHEANVLRLDCSRLRTVLGWKPRWNPETAVRKSVEWYQCWLRGGNVRQRMDCQISEYMEG